MGWWTSSPLFDTPHSYFHLIHALLCQLNFHDVSAQPPFSSSLEYPTRAGAGESTVFIALYGIDCVSRTRPEPLHFAVLHLSHLGRIVETPRKWSVDEWGSKDTCTKPSRSPL